MPTSNYENIIDATVNQHPPAVWRSGLKFRLDDELTALRIAYHYRGQPACACSIEMKAQEYIVSVSLPKANN
jgi:hypothetical protein